jgi:hypothetical protein
MRELIVPRLRASYPTARIIHELPLRYSSNRIDIAAVTEAEIIGVEIKSSRDVVARLAAQLTAFKPVCAKVIAALAPKWNERLPMMSETQTILRDIGHCETWTVDAGAGTVTVTDPAYAKWQPWAFQMLDMLWREELIAVATRHRCYVAGKGVTHSKLRDACEAYMTGQEVRAAVCAALRSRSAFDKMSDAALAT